MELSSTYPELFKKKILVCSGPITGVPVMKEDAVNIFFYLI